MLTPFRSLFLLLAVFLALPGSGQVRVTGTVSEKETRQFIPGATVWNVSQKTRSVADATGRFNVSVGATDTLEFRALGFAAQRVLLGGTGLTQMVVQVRLIRASILLGEVTVREGRPDEALINRALRNMKRPTPPVVSQVKRPPKPKPLFAVDSTAPKLPQPSIEDPIGLLYEQFSRAGRQRRKLAEILAKQRLEAAQQKFRHDNPNSQENRSPAVQTGSPASGKPGAKPAVPTVPRQPPAGSLAPHPGI